MSRLADEAMYFGAVADGVESQQEEIAALRKQLADSEAAVSGWKASAENRLQIQGEREKTIAELRQQLADLNRICEFDQKTNEQLLEQRDQLRKQVTLLRDALEYHQGQTRPIQTTIDALAATEPKP